MDAYRAVFREEAQELLAELEEGLLELEEQPDNVETVGRVFRAVHTIKGSGAMFGFNNLSEFAHQLETVLDKIRNGKLEATKSTVSLTLECRDLLTSLLQSDDEMSSEQTTVRDALLVRLREVVASSEGAGKNEAPAVPVAAPKQVVQVVSGKPAAEGKEATYRIRFTPGPSSLKEGCDIPAMIRELGTLGDLKVTARTGKVPPLETLDPDLFYISWNLILTTRRDVAAVNDVFVFMDNKAILKIEKIDDAEIPHDEPTPRLGDILRERGEVDHVAMEAAEKAREPIGAHLEKFGVVTKEQVAEALVEQEAIREARDKRKVAAAPAAASSSVRVSAEKLDYLVDLVGELVIAQARLTQTSIDKNDGEMISIAEEVERLTAELRDSTLGIRMVPIGTTFSRFKRLVRDLCSELGKEAELETEGADTELDKTVIEQLGDPLVHLIRNSVDHGIEGPEQRAASGKQRCGEVRLSAFHGGGHVIIKIQDDGAGLNPEKLRKKAIEKGLLAPDAEVSERELFHFIFAAGFSTAEKVSNVSGRGVGMDVVKRAIDALRGQISIDSELGKGTLITIRLPLTLAIIEGLLVKVSDENYVMPLQVVEECVDLTQKDIEAAHGSHLAHVRNELVPYIRMREWFAVPGDRPPIEQLVITQNDGERFGFVVDKVIGHHQTVIKNLGVVYRDVRGLSGATILGDGTVALILDARGLAQAASQG